MITTFFGPHRFGGDAVYVDRLTRALLRRGHEVHVIYCVDAFEAVRKGEPLHVYSHPKTLQIHPLRSRLKILSPFWSHQTGLMGIKRGSIQKLIDRYRFDVIHFHNISLMGAPQVLSINGMNHKPLKLMSAHEYWLVCPGNLLWKYNRKTCDKKTCLACVLRASRPPQMWRATGMMDRALKELDALIFPSRFSLKTHEGNGIHHKRLVCLPYFLPSDWAQPSNGKPISMDSDEINKRKGYFAAAGRLVKEKGFQKILPVMAKLPQYDLYIAGSGPFEAHLKREARSMHNVHFLGQLGFGDLAEVFKGAMAIVVPSLFYETFGYVAIEAFSMGTPAIVHDNGALPELIKASGGGFTYRTGAELFKIMKHVAEDRTLRLGLGSRAAEAVMTMWSEDAHIGKYLDLVREIAAEKEMALHC
jgi:glycosyltransferase involved in cell wall biosynthesis